MTCMLQVFYNLQSCVDRTLNRLFFHIGVFIAKHPGYFIIVPILLSLLCITGYQQLKYQIDPEYLFSPINGEGKAERAIVEQYFKINYTHRFNVGRITRPGRFGRVIVVSKDGNDNLIRREIFQELRQLDSLIQNATAVYQGESFTYRDACARWENECFENDILNLDYIMDEIETGELNLTFPLMFNPVTWDAHVFPIFFGGTQLTEDNVIVKVSAIQLVYFVTADAKQQDERGAEWEETFLKVVGEAEKSAHFKYISAAYFASRTLDHELEKNTQTVIPYFSSTFALMALFSVITCMMGDPVKSKPWLGLMGNISAVMATSAAFGLAMYLGVEFIGINLAAPFLMIGIGIDDTFVMLAAWRRTSTKMSVIERMGLTMSEAAVSITITSLTDVISFCIGVISPFRSVQIFCKYSALAVLFTFLWHITFFAACMAVSGYREYENRHAIFGCKVSSLSKATSEQRNVFYKVFMAGGIDHNDPDNPLDNKDHVLMAFFRDRLATLINNNRCKVAIIGIFVVYLVGACYGISQIREGLERRKLSRSDSYSVEFFDREDAYYREFPYRMQVIVTGNMNYSDKVVQNEIEVLTRKLENTSYVTSSLYTESWLRSFLSFVDRNDYLNISLKTEREFVAAVKEYWLYPGNPFSLDVKFNDDETRIIASRFLIQAVNITDTNHEKEMVQDLRHICKQSSLNVTIFHPYFVFFDQFELVRPTSLQAMIIGAVIMMLVSFIFIPHILCSLWVAFSVISIELGVAGYMALWDVNLDSISMINLIMCIGFSVDFTAHICYTYMSSSKTSPKGRVQESLHSVGLPIVQGSCSTILGVVALLLAKSYIFLVFFKMVFLVIFFGAMHGLFLLPVLLSLFGPGSRETWSSKNCNSKKKHTLEHKKEGDKNQIDFQINTSSYLENTSSVSSTRYGSKPFKLYGDEKDLGLGTSGEDSSESSSSSSQHKKALRDKLQQQQQCSMDGWQCHYSYKDFYDYNLKTQLQSHLSLYNQIVSAKEWNARLDEDKYRKQSYENYQSHALSKYNHFQLHRNKTEYTRKKDPIKLNSSMGERHNASNLGCNNDFLYNQNSNSSAATTITKQQQRRPRRYSDDYFPYKPQCATNDSKDINYHMRNGRVFMPINAQHPAQNACSSRFKPLGRALSYHSLFYSDQCPYRYSHDNIFRPN